MERSLKYCEKTYSILKDMNIEISWHGREKNEAAHYCSTCEVRFISLLILKILGDWFEAFWENVVTITLWKNLVNCQVEKWLLPLGGKLSCRRKCSLEGVDMNYDYCIVCIISLNFLVLKIWKCPLPTFS